MDPLAGQRHLFETDDAVAYLNTAYLAPRLHAVSEAGRSAVERTARPWTIAPPDFFTTAERVRGKVARLFGGDAEGVAIIPAVSYGLSMAAANVGDDRPAHVVVLAEQFPSNVYCWRALADRTGGAVVTVPRPSNDDWTAAVLEHIGDETTVVAVPHCHWTDGTFVDLTAVGKAARDVGAALVVDLTQSLGALPFEAATLQPDYAVAAAYKWLLGPYSLGFLWAAPHRREGQPLEHSWVGRAGSEDFASLTTYRDDYRAGARRYDVGEAAHFVLLPMAEAALDQLLAWSVARIADTLDALNRDLAGRLAQLGLAVPERERRAGHLLGVRLPHGRARGLPERLAKAGVHISVRGDALRVSPHLHTSPDDVDRLVGVLEGMGR